VTLIFAKTFSSKSKTIHSVLKRKTVLVKMDANAPTDIDQSVEPMVKPILIIVTEDVEKQRN